MNPNTIALAIQIADSAARSDIECYCAMAGAEGQVGDDHYLQWYDTQDIDDACPPEDITLVLQYLQLRGLVQRHPVNPAFVSFPKNAAAMDAAA